MSHAELSNTFYHHRFCLRRALEARHGAVKRYLFPPQSDLSRTGYPPVKWWADFIQFETFSVNQNVGCCVQIDRVHTSVDGGKSHTSSTMSTSRGSIVTLASASIGTDKQTVHVGQSDSLDRSSHQMPGRNQLSSQDYVELTRISRKKDDIEQHIDGLQRWPAWDPFQNVSTYSADLDCLEHSKTTLDAITSNLQSRRKECSRLERDVDQFNLEDMKRLRTVAKAVSKRHLSGPDTDLLELALETVFALDRLLRLLRERQQEHEVTELRLQWERMVCSSWADVGDLRRDIKAFEHKCKALACSKPNSHPLSSSQGTQRQHEDVRTAVIDAQHDSTEQRMPKSTSASSSLAMESLKLESSRLVLRIRSFETEKARPAGKLLDLLIDQRQVPEKLIDEQEKLEDALPHPSSVEANSLHTLSLLGQSSVSLSSDHDPGKSLAAELESKNLVRADESKLINPSTSGSLSVQTLATPQDRLRNVGSATPPRKGSASSLLATPVRHASNRYRSNPRDALDVAIGDIVNRLSISVSITNASLTGGVTSARPPGLQDLSGQYWIGDPDPRLCFCRFLPSNLVMVRVGGGWQELSEFLMQHYAHLSPRGAHSDGGESSGRQTSNLAWMRSASGPVGSPRLRTRSSVRSLRSHEAMHTGTPRSSSRIVTMPCMRKASIMTPVNEGSAQPNYITELHQVPFECRDRGFSPSCTSSDVPSSNSSSSIVIHPSSPSSSAS